MKMFRYRIFCFIIPAVLIIHSCKPKEKINDYSSLKNKYENYVFEDCPEMIQFVSSFLDIYVEIIDRAYLNDQEALNEYVLINNLFAKHSQAYMKLQNKCPQDFRDVENLIDSKLELRIEKLSKIKEYLSSPYQESEKDYFERFGAMDENYFNPEDWHPDVYSFVVKYNETVFESCDHIIAFRKEYADLLEKSLLEAEQGDENAKLAIINLTAEIYPFLMQFEKQYDVLYAKCPEKLNLHMQEFNERLDLLTDRILKLFEQEME